MKTLSLCFCSFVLFVLTGQNAQAAVNAAQERTGTDSMIADFLDMHWVAEECLMDTVADEWLSAKKHAYLFEIIGVGGGDTLHIAIPSYTGAPIDAPKPVHKKNLFLSALPSAQFTSQQPDTVAAIPTLPHGDIVYYRYAPLDTGYLDTTNIFPIDYVYPLDAALRIPQPMLREGELPKIYFNGASGGRHTGIVHITHVDTNYIAGTFEFDLRSSASEDENAVHVKNGRFRYHFPKPAKKENIASN
ncbi:MAG TPA: hypothetical protein VFJ29_06070 [Candidatus Kapabacteria bacterium]|nr:hypothetical protein [Candidatus Kapabacteria bacterium]